jgi:hypothetical protein
VTLPTTKHFDNSIMQAKSLKGAQFTTWMNNQVKPCLLNDLTHPLIVLSDLQRKEIKHILEEVKK